MVRINASPSIGVISDTHGKLRSEVLRTFRDVDLIIHAGDIGSYSVLEGLRRISPVVAVRGNMDDSLWAESLSDLEIVEFDGHSIGVIHDIQDFDIDPSGANISVVIFGHSHRPLIKRERGILYLNPGSAGPKRFKIPPTAAILTIREGTPRAEIKFLEE